MICLCESKDGKRGVVYGENRADAVLMWDNHILGDDVQDREMLYRADDSISGYCDILLAEYEVTELHRHDVLEYVERRLDGDTSITILI